jgi:hypothetical protein
VLLRNPQPHADSSSRPVEIGHTAAVLAGWASLTHGVRVIAWGRVASAVWPISTGLLLLSACGWGFLSNTAVVGLYVASRKRGER